jgi:hypothetical protein
MLAIGTSFKHNTLIVGEQLAELEILQSMFPGPGELTLEDQLIALEMTDFVSGTGAIQQPPDSSLSMKLRLNGLEVVMRLPQDYPGQAPPEVYLRSCGEGVGPCRKSHYPHFEDRYHPLVLSLLSIKLIVGGITRGCINRNKNISEEWL